MNLIPLEEVQARVPLSMATLRRLCTKGKLDARKLENRWFVTPESVDAWIEQGKPEPGVIRPGSRIAPKRQLREAVAERI